ncbi:MAG: DNA polymerase III subunit alpha [Flavobacteriales bacterium]|nr:DNA polymerase III subunit alpha [Flavobacteriales bacterium]
MYLIFDTETTGRIENWKAPVSEFESFPRVVQLAWQLHDYKGELIDVKNYIIKPDGYTIPFNAEKIHGISTERAQKIGVPIEFVMDEFKKALADTDFAIGHNIEFDTKVLGAEYARARRDDGLMEKRTLDTMQLSTNYCQLPGGRGKGFKYPTLSELNQKLFGEAVDNAHNASADVEATTRCFLELIRVGVIGIKELESNKEYIDKFKEHNPSTIQLIGLNIAPYKPDDLVETEEPEKAANAPSKTALKENEQLLSDYPFVHLHNHTQFSILQSTSAVKSIVRQAAAFEMPAIAITDLGNMMGVFHFVKECEMNGIKAIVGCEFFVAAEYKRHQFTKDDPDRRFRQVLIAKNENGYHNLSKLCSVGFIDGFYAGLPRVGREVIVEFKEDLICTTGGLGGEIPNLILNIGEQQAEEAFNYWHTLFGDDFYVQLMRHDLEEEVRVNEVLLRFCAKYGVKYFAANDVYYQSKEDANAHDILLCVKDGVQQDMPIGRGRGFRFGMPNQEFYFKSQKEMKEKFKDLPDAITTVSEIIDKVEEYKLGRDILLPKFDIPEEFEDENAFLAHLTYEGAKKKYGEITDEIKDRLDFELKVIKDMGFPGYFLIVQDFTTEARKLGVWVGPGRGSAAGSAVAFSVGITNIDPIKYKLLFERFLNPERVTMPDIDIDFDDEGRDRIIDYVVKKYGQTQVAQIITYGTMAAKSSIRDVARVLDLPLGDADRIAKLVPDLKKFKHIFGRAKEDLKKDFNGDDLTNVQQLIAISEQENEEGRILNQARKLEGSVRNTGIHACGVIITPQDIREFIPVATAKDSDLLLTQFDNSVVESAGLLKMDFLGLKTLTVMKDAIKLAKQRHNVDIDPDTIPLDDPKTFELYQRGETNGTFQFESVGMQKNLRLLKPTGIEDLIAMNALYRPGPLQFIDLFINRKHGREKVEYPHEKLEPILKDTYGIMVYQEQIMQTAQILAGYSLGTADILRRAMGKKKMDVMEEQRVIFRDGCAKHNDIDGETADKIFDVMMKFAEYGFNRSHSAAYSVVAFQTAYLKANYPAEYMASVLTHNMGDIKKVTFFMEECKRMGIPVLGPDVNESAYKFAVNSQGEIRFGMGAIKGVGEAAVEAIVAEQLENGPYRSIFDFASRLDLRSVNKKNFEGLAIAGSFDCFQGVHRAQYFAEDEKGSTLIEKAVRYGNAFQEAKNSSQASLFGDTEDAEIPEPSIPEAPEWTTLDQLNREKEVVGVYISGHPLDDFRFEQEQFANAATVDLHDIEAMKQRRDIKVAGIITKAEHLTSKTGNPYGKFTLEDYEGTHEFMLFKDDYIRFKNYLTENWFVLVSVGIQSWFNKREQRETSRLSVTKIDLLAELREKMVKQVVLDVEVQSISDKLIDRIKGMCSKNKGSIPIQINVHDNGTIIEMPSRSMRVNLTREVTEQLESLENIIWSIKKA